MFLLVAQAVFSALIAVGAIFYVRDTLIAYRAWKVALLLVDFILSCGAMFALAFYQKQPDIKPLWLLLPFLIGAGVFSLAFFAAQGIASSFSNETVARIVGVVVLLSFYVSCVSVQIYFRVRKDRAYVLWLTAFAAICVYALSLIFSCLLLPQEKLFKAFSSDAISFERASAEELVLTDGDRALSRAWFAERLEGEIGSGLAFDFSLGGKRFVESASEWEDATEKVLSVSGDIKLVREFTHRVEGVKARLEAYYYEETATVEWTVYLSNEGENASSVLSDVYALNAPLPIASSDLYFSGGSNEAKDDFALYRRSLPSRKKKTYVFDTADGRSSELYLPFFNLFGEGKGATIGVGWSGEWTAAFSSGKNVRVKVSQSELRGAIEKGETIRTPLVSLSLYSGGTPLKGFNNFRNDIKRGLGEGYRESSFLLFAGAAGQDDTSRANESGTHSYVEKLQELGLSDTLDYAWYDAAWYDLKGGSDWRNAVGNWTADPEKYPNGLGAVSNYLGENGVGMLLWYEPERVSKSSDLYKEIKAKNKTDEWLISVGGENCLLHMGNGEAREYIKNKIVASLKENGVAYYRQDYNIEPKAYWEKADKELYGGRKGFAENLYVTGEYAFLDALREEIPGLLIDNCASGGRRIDLETCRRSIPLWRSDYACFTDKKDLSEAAQYETYGLSFWLPYSSTANPSAANEYELRSVIGACVNCYADILFDHPEAYVSFIRDYEKVKEYFARNYYPLTPCAPRSSFVAMQFGSEEKGVIVAFDRTGKGKANAIKPNGLSLEASYKVSFVEGGEIAAKRGEDLMKKGFSVRSEKKKAYLIVYEKQG